MNQLSLDLEEPRYVSCQGSSMYCMFPLIEGNPALEEGWDVHLCGERLYYLELPGREQPDKWYCPVHGWQSHGYRK